MGFIASSLALYRIEDANMNGQIFISYRREDASWPAGRMYDRLQSRFPHNEIFMDVDSIKPGIDFVKTHRRAGGRLRRAGGRDQQASAGCFG
jgi:hypothetical protein